MKTENKNVMIIMNDEGEKIECEVIATVESPKFKKHYLIYTDRTIDENGNIRTFAHSYDPMGESLNLEPITDAEEWDMIENILASAQKKALNETRKRSED